MAILRIFSVLVTLLVVQPAEAHFGAEKTIYLGLGMISQDVGRETSSDTGTAGLFTANYTDVQLIGDFSFLGAWHLSPMIAYTPLGNKSADTNEKSYLLPIAVRLKSSFGLFDVFAGPGLLIYSISGSGGTATLNNGTSTAVFGLPSTSASSKLLMLDVGVDRDIFNFKLAAEAMVTGLLSTRRAFNLMVSLSYGVL